MKFEKRKKMVVSKPTPCRPTIASAFLREQDPESDCRSFSQLLAGAMASSSSPPPLGNGVTVRPKTVRLKPILPPQGDARDDNCVVAAEGKERIWKQKEGEGEGAVNVVFKPLAKLGTRNPLSSLANLGPFGISHQQALAQVQAQAQAQAHSQMQPQPASAPAPALVTFSMPQVSSAMTSSMAISSSPGFNTHSPQKKTPLKSEMKQMMGSPKPAPQSTEHVQQSLPPIPVGDRPSFDGYNWRKYGQKQVKGSEYPRSYYKCTHPNCPVKKKVERSHDGQVTEIVYKGEHNHLKPQPTRRTPLGTNLHEREMDSPGAVSGEKGEYLEVNVDQSSPGFYAEPSGRTERLTNNSDASTSVRGLGNGNGSPEQSFCLSDDGEDLSRAEDEVDDEPDSKRRKKDKKIKELLAPQRTSREPRVIVQTTEADILEDGFRWRKYGQKVVKGNPYPRSYYKCTSVKSNTRLLVELNWLGLDWIRLYWNINKRVNMLVSALLTSVGINVGLCILLLLLYSILRKQPGNVTVYAPRMVAEERAKQRGALERFVPSAGWILRAWRASEDELLAGAGFDAYVFLRVFVYSLRIFSFAGVIGVFVLLPINYFGKDFVDIPNQSLDSFTIANVKNGSKRLWVHFCAVYLISGAACCLLYLEYRDIAAKRFSYFYSSPPEPSHFTILVRGIPKFDRYSMSDTVEEFFTQYHSSTYLSHQMVYHTDKVQALMCEAEMLYKKILQLKEKPRLQRQHRREGFLGLFGAKVDPVDHYTKKLENVEENVRLGQSEFLQNQKEVPAAFVSFKSRYGAAVASHIPQSTNPLLWVTKSAPEPRDIYWRFLSAPYLQRWIGGFVVMVAVFFLTILFLVPVAFVQGLTQLNTLEEYLPFLKKVLTIKFISSIITGYLPSLILLLFMKCVPPIMMLFSAMQGFVSNSGKQKSASIKVLYFTIWNVFFATVLSGSAISQINNFLTNPKDIPRQLAVVVPGQASFFITYVLTSGWTGLSLEITRLFPLIVEFFRRHFSKGIEDEDQAPAFPYHEDLPKVLLFGLLGFTYSLLAPLILPFLLVYFSVGYIMYRNQMLHVYSPKFETKGQYWPIVHNCTIFSLIFMQIITIGIFGLKNIPLASTLVIPICIITLLFNNYCGKRFSPMFNNYPAEVLIKRDREDERNPQMDSFLESLRNAYRDPALQPIQFSTDENGNKARLLSIPEA